MGPRPIISILQSLIRIVCLTACLAALPGALLDPVVENAPCRKGETGDEVELGDQHAPDTQGAPTTPLKRLTPIHRTARPARMYYPTSCGVVGA
jgi:hypothetical protein